MKKIIGYFTLLIFVVGLVGFTNFNLLSPNESIAGELGPVVVVSTPLVNMAGKKTAGVVIGGTGFKPNQEIHILFTAQNGVQSDIGAYIKPELKVDKSGTWGTTWNAGRYVRRKLIKGGTYTLTVTDSEYKPLAMAPVGFIKNKKAKKKK